MLNSLGLFVTLVDGCNLDCQFCQFPPKAEFRSGNRLDAEKFIAFLSNKNKCDGLNIPIGAVSFCGSGEPLLYSGIAELVEQTKEYAPFVSVVTNGVLLTEELSVKLINAGIDHIVISITGITNAVYSEFQGSGRKVGDSDSQLEVVKNNIKRLVEIKDKLHSNTQIGISYLLDEKSQVDYFDALNYWNDMGVNYVDTRRRQKGYNYKTENFDEYVKNNSKWWSDGNCCTCFGKVMNIFTDGRISICNCVEPDLIIGNIYTQSISEIINSPKFIRMYKAVTKDYLSMPDICKRCDMLRARPFLT